MAYSSISPEDQLIRKEDNDKYNRSLSMKSSWLFNLFERNKISPHHRKRIIQELVAEHKQNRKAV